MELAKQWETLEGEHLKTAAEFSLHALARVRFGERIFELARGGPRVEATELQTQVAGLHLENPLLVGAGWDKRGWAVDGLYALGFAGTEVGSVLVHPQAGNPRPRLFTDKTNHAVGLNRLGFNSKGMEAVAQNLDGQERPGVVGISLGKNKLTPDDQAPWAHAAVAERLHKYADYFVINVASPNTPGLRNLLNPRPLAEIVHAVQEILRQKGMKPLFIKTTVDLALEDLDNVLQVCVEEGVDGVIDSNTTVRDDIKLRYGWEGQMGGVSGSDPIFRKLATERMRHITRATKGTSIHRIGVGGINDATSAIERIEAGAEALQVVTGIRERKGRIAREINTGILEYVRRVGAVSVAEIVGIAA